jgi:hypothetical protein
MFTEITKLKKICPPTLFFPNLTSDQYVFGPPGSGSGSIRQRYGSGAGSFYHQAKIVRKTLIPTFFYFLSLKNYVNVPYTSNKQKTYFFNYFFVGVFKVNDE